MKVLLVIDLQEQFKDTEGKWRKVKEFIDKNRQKYDIILPTVFINDIHKNSFFIDKLDWGECLDASVSDCLVYPKNKFDLDKVIVEIKYGYVSKAIFNVCSKTDEIDIVGCESDSCIFATAFSLWDAGYNFQILTDYIYSCSDAYTDDFVINCLRRNFGRCVV